MTRDDARIGQRVIVCEMDTAVIRAIFADTATLEYDTGYRENVEWKFIEPEPEL
jgi:hypothetical protein